MTSPHAADLQIVALLRYIDACSSLATPHSDCPLAEALAEPATRCLPACRDVVTGLLRRGRAAVASTSEDFDARQILLSEPREEPNILWHTASLLQIVARVTRSSPLDDSGTPILQREIFGTSSLALLGQRGLDPDQIVRYGFGDRIKFAIVSNLTRIDKSPAIASHTMPYYEEWRDVFGVGENGDRSNGGYLRSAINGQASRFIESWLMEAGLMDLLRWNPLNSAATGAWRDAGTVEIYQWLVDRFTQTYLHKWSLASLKREYATICGQADAVFPLEILQERIIPHDRVAVAVANAAVFSSTASDSDVLGALTEQAVELLKGGERTAAAALFDAARAFSPGDPRVRNNYAFCILLDKPDEARVLLEDALSMDTRDKVVTLCNLALVEHLLDRDDVALAQLADAFEATRSDRRDAFLWEQDEAGEWQVADVSPEMWIVRLGTKIEERLGSPGRWTETAIDLRR